MTHETAPPRCANPFCRFTAHFAVTDEGIEKDEFCSPVCGQLMRYMRVAASIESGPAAERLSQMLVETADLLNERGDDPRKPDLKLASRVARRLLELV